MQIDCVQTWSDLHAFSYLGNSAISSLANNVLMYYYAVCAKLICSIFSLFSMVENNIYVI